MPRKKENRVTADYVADFETTTDPNDCRVWVWGMCNISDPENSFTYDIDIDSFMKTVRLMKSRISFQNLAFDGSFILDWLLKHGFEHVQNKYLLKNQFSTIISDQGQFYSISIKWDNSQTTEFRDSLKKLPMSVSSISKAFKLPESKGELDYKAYREIGHIPTVEEIDYLKRDVIIVAKALAQQINEGMVKLTVGADSLAEYKDSIGGPKRFLKLFPKLNLEVDDDIRNAYRGGFSYVNPAFKGVITKPGLVYDVNSLYPSVMRSKILPYGYPIFVQGKPETSEDYPLFIASITLTAKLKKNHIPCIQIKKSMNYVATVYQEEISEPVTLFCTNIDLNMWERHYDLNIISYNGGYLFKGTTGLFNSFIDKWSEIKANSDGGMRTIAKLHLNSLYGKFATNPHMKSKIPILVNDTVKLVPGKPEDKDPIYTPIGVFITSYARDVTIKAGQANFENFAYCDTDSLHLIVDTPPSNLDIHDTKLGAWKHEMSFDAALFIRSKCYTERGYDGNFITHIAGLPASIAKSITFDDFYEGHVFSGKLRPRRVPGGIVLEEVDFTLQV